MIFKTKAKSRVVIVIILYQQIGFNGSLIINDDVDVPNVQTVKPRGTIMSNLKIAFGFFVKCNQVLFYGC